MRRAPLEIWYRCTYDPLQDLCAAPDETDTVTVTEAFRELRRSRLPEWFSQATLERLCRAWCAESQPAVVLRPRAHRVALTDRLLLELQCQCEFWRSEISELQQSGQMHLAQFGVEKLRQYRSALALFLKHMRQKEQDFSGTDEEWLVCVSGVLQRWSEPLGLNNLVQRAVCVSQDFLRQSREEDQARMRAMGVLLQQSCEMLHRCL
jgi:hypothetical protein